MMPVITKISEQKRRPTRRNIFLDGKFAFGLKLNVVAKFRLKEGMNLSPEQIRDLQSGEVRQQCFDKAMSFLSARMHSRAEIVKKLSRNGFEANLIHSVCDELQRLEYIDDKRFAISKATSSAKAKHHGKRRAALELIKAGVQGETARRALEDVYESHDSMQSARLLAEKKAPSLRKLDPETARRRMYGMLLRRGFNYEEIRPVVEQVLGPESQARD